MGERGRVLIANRGEIAIRIAKAAAGLALESVAVYSPVDAQCLHTHYGTEARQIGSGSDASTDAVGAYLDVDALLHTALDTGCDRVHPGYGFLAESAVFAERCAVAGLTFIGPEPETLRLFGDKLRAREFAKSLGIPVVPGSAGPLGSPEEALTLAERLGYPLMVKATAGGGGRGIRKVTRPDEISEAFDRCRSEALAAFGDGSLFLVR